MINLLELEPTKISKNLKGKFLLVYGEPKCGKTTLLSKLPKSLILAFEAGTNALNNAYIQPIEKWTDFKMVLKQLKNPAVQEKFDFIGIDTADIAWDLCVKYICIQNSVENLSDIPWGKGFDMCKKEYSEAFRQLALMGYGICFVSHSTEKTFKDEKGEDYIRIVPALPNRPYDIVNKMVDIIGYIRSIKNPDTKEQKTFLFFRGDDRFLAGARFKHITPRIEFTYENLAGAIYEAIDKQAAEDGTTTTDTYNNFYEEKQRRPFDDAMAEAKELWVKLTEGNEANAYKILDTVEKVFGKRMKISEATEPQQELLELVIDEMRDM